MNIASEKINYNLGNTYFMLKKYDSALFYFNAIKMHDKGITVKKLNDIGRILTEQGNWTRAEKIFDSAILINKQQVGLEKAITPGQACVIYDKTRMLGGGWILRE